jgi:hypothetical protein
VVNFVCLKWGTKYDASFVNRLYTMIVRNCKVPFTLHCCTEDPSGIHPEINIIPLPNYDLESFWYKVWITSNEFPVEGKCIFFDLDIVIQNDLSKLIEYECNDKIMVLKAQWRWNSIRKGMPMTKINSSVMIWDNTKRTDTMFSTMMTDPEFYMFRYNGNDDYLEARYKSDYETLPHEWFYCRVWGYDDTDPKRGEYAPDRYIDLWNIELQLYRMPDRMICIFNGIRGEEGIDSRIYDGFEYYWGD